MGSDELTRTRTDEEAIEQLAEADDGGAHVVDLATREDSWLVGTGNVTSAVQVQPLATGSSPRDALDRQGLLLDGEHRRAEKDERNPE